MTSCAFARVFGQAGLQDQAKKQKGISAERSSPTFPVKAKSPRLIHLELGRGLGSRGERLGTYP